MLFLTLKNFFLDCLRSSFKEEIGDKNISCSLPWIQSMLGQIGSNSSISNTCNNALDFQSISVSGLQFAKKIAKYRAPKCEGICNI